MGAAAKVTYAAREEMGSSIALPRNDVVVFGFAMAGLQGPAIYVPGLHDCPALIFEDEGLDLADRGEGFTIRLARGPSAQITADQIGADAEVSKRQMH
jgi:hypothetical protein